MTKEREKYLEKREEEVSRFYGLQFDRHGLWSDPTVEVSWDLISKPMSSLAYDISNGQLTSASLPDIVLGKRWIGQPGSPSSPAIAFESNQQSGMYLKNGADIGFSVSGTEKVLISNNFEIAERLVWRDGTSYKGEFIHANSADRTYTFQDVTGTVYQTGGTDVAIADGGTGQSTRTFATVYKAADQDHDDDTLY